MLDDDRVSLLIYKSLRSELSPLEERELNEWISFSQGNRNFFDQEINGGVLKGVERSLAMNEDRMNQRMSSLLSKEAPVKKMSVLRWSMAAAVAGILMIGAWFLIRNKGENADVRQAIVTMQVVKPGGNKAVLTLADGNKIVLDSAQNGTIAKQGSSQVVKTASGQVAYTRVGISAPVGFNVITTPKGGQYQVTLSDGTQVWLNASSSIKFPTSFIEKIREVEITGEAYFEVTRNKLIPFHVRTGNVDVQVIGTSFNVMAYDDEKIWKTTLISGSVKVAIVASSDNQPGVILKPGQQAQMVDASLLVGDHIQVVNADIDEAISWKNGITSFKNEDIRSIMRKIARWYDIDISYEGNLPERKFMGGLSRNSTFADLINVLELNHIHTRLDGKTLIVMP
jgi:transmembrane sensor